MSVGPPGVPNPFGLPLGPPLRPEDLSQHNPSTHAWPGGPSWGQLAAYGTPPPPDPLAREHQERQSKAYAQHQAEASRLIQELSGIGDPVERLVRTLSVCSELIPYKQETQRGYVERPETTFIHGHVIATVLPGYCKGSPDGFAAPPRPAEVSDSAIARWFAQKALQKGVPTSRFRWPHPKRTGVLRRVKPMNVLGEVPVGYGSEVSGWSFRYGTTETTVLGSDTALIGVDGDYFCGGWRFRNGELTVAGRLSTTGVIQMGRLLGYDAAEHGDSRLMVMSWG